MALIQEPEAGTGDRHPLAVERVRLLDEQPDLAAHVDAEHWELARETVTVPAVAVAPGPWDPQQSGAGGRQPFATLVLRGLIARTIDIGSHPGLELYSPGDVIGVSTVRDSVLPAGESWTATTPSLVAILDDEFLVAVRRWPRLVTGVFDQFQRQRDRLALQLVIVEQPRVEDRLLGLFWLLSERYGRVSGDGVVLGLKLTHEALGRLIGAQRPTVTLALKALRGRGAVQRRDDGSWLLVRQPAAAIGDAATLPASHAPVPVDAGELEPRAELAREGRLPSPAQRTAARAARAEAAAMKRAAKDSLLS